MERERLFREREGISLKRISPDHATLKMWARFLPPSHDQIFLPANFSPAVAHGLALEKIKPGAKRKSWSLIDRSWFGHLANRAAHRIVLPPGKLSGLPSAQRQALKKFQIKMKNPALVPSRLLPAPLRDSEPFTWLSAGFFRGLGAEEKIAALHAWDKAGKFTGVYPRMELPSLPIGPKKILKLRRLLKLVNTFAPISGPNCFAAVAYAMTGKHLQKWMHPPDFMKIVQRQGYRLSEEKPKPGDVLVCRQKGAVVHAALYLGGFVFEKPGQDFYEPYRLARWSRWRQDWAHTSFECWRAH